MWYIKVNVWSPLKQKYIFNAWYSKRCINVCIEKKS